MIAWRTFEYRVLMSSWGIAIDLRARLLPAGDSPLASAAGVVADGIFLDVSQLTEPTENVAFIFDGVRRMAGRIRDRAGLPVVLEIDRVDYTPTDFQPDGLTVAVMSWLAEELDLPQFGVSTMFDVERKRYQFDL